MGRSWRYSSASRLVRLLSHAVPSLTPPTDLTYPTFLTLPYPTYPPHLTYPTHPTHATYLTSPTNPVPAADRQGAPRRR